MNTLPYIVDQAHRLIEELTGQVAEYQQAVRELEGRLEAKEAAREEHVLESLATRMSLESVGWERNSECSCSSLPSNA